MCAYLDGILHAHLFGGLSAHKKEGKKIIVII